MVPSVFHHLGPAQDPYFISQNILSTPHTLYTKDPSKTFTCWKQLRTLGSMLLPPKAATSPSCRGIWIASCSNRPSCLWSHISVGPATSLKRSTRKRGKQLTSHTDVLSKIYLWLCGMNNADWKKTHGDVHYITCLLHSDNSDILYVCNQELVKYMFPRTIYCSIWVNMNRPINTNFLFKWPMYAHGFIQWFQIGFPSDWKRES